MGDISVNTRAEADALAESLGLKERKDSFRHPETGEKYTATTPAVEPSGVAFVVHDTAEHGGGEDKPAKPAKPAAPAASPS